MSGYLNTLAAKHLGVAEIIWPRLSARFEPPHAAEAAMTSAFAPAESLVAEETKLVESGVGIPLFPLGGRASSPLSLDGRGQGRGCLPVTHLRLDATRPLSLTLSHKGREDKKVVNLLPPDTTRPLSLTLSHEGREDKKAGNLPSMKERAISRQQELLSGQSSVESVAPSNEQQSLTRRHAEVVTPSSVRPVIPTTIVVQPRATRSSEPQSPPLAESPAAAQPTPNVQVTIGRIEVRAVQPSAKPHRPRPTQPVMSLDEYLKQRHGGQR